MKHTFIIFAALLAAGFSDAKTKKSPEQFTPSFRLKPATEKISCSAITDELCEVMWDKNHQGFLNIKGGRVQAGDLPESDIQYLAKVDFEAFVDSEPRLPPLLKKTLQPYLAKLKKLLQSKTFDQKVGRELSVLRYQWGNAVIDLAYEQAEKKFPGIRKIKNDKRTFEQHREISLHLIEFNNQVLDAKYKNHPNWLRVEKIFTEVKRDLTEQVQLLPFDADFKPEILDRLEKVRLMLPYDDPRLITSGNSCDETEMNAFYVPSRNAFTVCAGYFNAFPNEPTIYRVIAHELSHSLDPGNLISKRTLKELPLVKTLELLTHDLDAVTCNEWNDMIESRRKNRSDMKVAIQPQLPSLISCLGDYKKLTPWDAGEARTAARTSARNRISDGADYNNFLEMVQPFTVEDGVKRVNEYFLRPDLALKRSNDYLDSTAEVFGARMTFITVKNLKCQPQFKGLYEEMKSGTKEITPDEFRELVEVSDEVVRFEREDIIRYNGQTGPYMSRNHMSFDPDELFADWLAFQAMKTKMSRMTDINDRREFAFLSVASSCSKPSINTTAKELSAVQKEFSLEPHPERSARMRSVFTKSIAEQLNCKPPPKLSNVGSCDVN